MTFQIEVLFFATLKEKAGISSFDLSLPQGSRVKDLKQKLREKFPSLTPHLESAIVAINREFAFDEDLIPQGAQAALFPPVSGGAENPITMVKITDEALDLNQILASVTSPSTGAACVFTGMVRAITEGSQSRQTAYLDYEAYRPMALKKIEQVALEIRKRWPLIEGIAIIQRIGRLIPETPTVLIACSAAHRDSGVFEAARYGIDRLKEIVPIWKKEVGPDAEVWVEGEYLPQPEDRQNGA